MAASGVIKVRMFGRLRELADVDDRDVETHPEDVVRDVLARVLAEEPRVAEVVSADDAGTAFAVALDHVYVTADAQVVGCRELALIPPVSGG